jgi:predicted RNase H-like HicB family nuclease
MKTKKSLEEYMGLPYTIEITPDEDSYFVKIKELDGCMSVGETKSDALAMIEDAKHEWLAVAIDDGIDIPLPEAMQADRYSGKFPLRIPKSLHRKLAENADKDGTSLNQYMVMLLSERNALNDIKRIFAEQETQLCEVPVEHPMTYIGQNRKVVPLRMVGAK